MTPEKQKPDFSKLTEDFVYGSLALSPVSATQAGYHEHHGVRLDEKLDDFSPAGADATRKLDAEYQIIQNAVDLSWLELQQIQNYRHNPTTYVELVGNALFSPFVLEYAPVDVRFGHIIQRLSQVPVLMDQAKMNL